jgi:ankyrin repeat protein
MANQLKGAKGRNDSGKPRLSSAQPEVESPKSAAKRHIVEKLNKILFDEANSSNCNPYIIEELLDRGANPNAIIKMPWSDKPTSLFLLFAVESDNIGLDSSSKKFIYRMLYSHLKRKIVRSCETQEQKDIALVAVSAHPKGREIAEKLLETGANVNVQYEGYTPLLCAINSGNTEVSRFLLGKEAYISIRGPGGKTALMMAAEKGYADLCGIMLEQRLNFWEIMKNVRSIVNEEFFKERYIRQRKPPSLVEMLTEKGLYINSKDNHGGTALYYAIKNGHLRICKMLIDNGATADMGDLLVAKMGKHEDICRIVCEKIKQDVGKDRETDLKKQLEDAVEYGEDIGLARKIIDAMMDKNSKSSIQTEISYDLKDAFLNAIRKGNVELCKLMIEKGADVNNGNANRIYDRSPLSVAAEKDNEDLCKMLYLHGADMLEIRRDYPKMYLKLGRMEENMHEMIGTGPEALEFRKNFGKCINA